VHLQAVGAVFEVVTRPDASDGSFPTLRTGTNPAQFGRRPQSRE
jgi:hypothetical protein